MITATLRPGSRRLRSRRPGPPWPQCRGSRSRWQAAAWGCSIGVLVGVLALGILGCGLGGPKASPHPVVIVYMLDAARADFFSSYGHPFETTPEMDGMAAQGARFARHYSHSHITARSVPQLFTSRLDAPPLVIFPPGWDMPWWDRDEIAGDDILFLPAFLRGQGYATQIVTTHPWTPADSRFSRGFESYYEVPRQSYYASAERVFKHARKALEDYVAEGLDRPLFLYIHLLDTHTPHEPRPPNDKFFSLDELGWTFEEWRKKQPGIRNRKILENPDPKLLKAYHGAIRSSLAYTDQELGRFKEWVESTLDAPTLHVVTSDHGDAIGEQGYFEHILANFGTDAVHHIPLIMSGHGVPPGKVVESLTGTVDVLPTLLDILGLKAPDKVILDGRSTTRLMEDSRPRKGRLIPYVHRMGWKRARLGFRNESGSMVLTEDHRLFRNDGSFDFTELGSWSEVADQTPEAFQRLVVGIRARLENRSFEPIARSMNVPLAEFEIQSELDGCWKIPGWRQERKQIRFERSSDAECLPFEAAAQLPRQEYEIRWKVGDFDPSTRLRISLPEVGVAWEVGADQVADDELRLGTAPTAIERTRIRVESLVGSGPVVLKSLRLMRVGSLQPEEVEEVDPETIEQLRSLGYLD